MILDQNYIALKTQVIKAERRVLKELGFCVHIKHPHKIIVMYLQVLSYEKNKTLMQLAWNYMNDSLRTDAFVRYQPEVIACACIYLTARKLKLPLPKSPAWYLVFGVSEREIKDVCLKILRLYNRPKPNADALEKKVEELCKQYQDAKVKARGGSENNTPSHSGSPSSPGQKVSGGTHNAWGGFISRSGTHVAPSSDKPRSRSRSPSHSPVNKHHKRSKKHTRTTRSRSPTTRTHKKSHKRRASYSRSRSNSPHKLPRKTGREKTRHKTRSSSQEGRSTSYDKAEKNDRHERESGKYEKYSNKDDKYLDKTDRYLDSDKYESKKDRYSEKNDKNGDKNDKYNDKYVKDEKYTRDDRDKERYKKSKHRDDEKSESRERSKDRRR